MVGITGLEPATSRPPDVCATNCAKSRSLIAVAKVRTFGDITKFYGYFFTIFYFQPRLSPCFYLFFMVTGGMIVGIVTCGRTAPVVFLVMCGWDAFCMSYWRSRAWNVVLLRR